MASSWRFLTNHAHVLLAVAAGPHSLVDDIAASVGITKRQALAILKDLEQDGYLKRTRVGRRNQYTLHPQMPMRHPALAEHEVSQLLGLLGRP
jgi:DNA-binding MarR family transcriptional regulator